ncbi:MAG: flagellar hook basal-body protein [Planctomycetaceae bacterium]|jgi:flagellar basal-body rod protein FlgF/flagellar basal-body rod protein FlgG|nr:flagellar hook basal-body protein [Planctomycetaceae bacterium]
MSFGLYISAEGAHAQNYRLETIANNIANVNTPGFKRELAMQQARFTKRTELGQDVEYSGTMNDVSGGVRTIGTLTEFKQGKSIASGNKEDMEIVGEGYFVVQNIQTGEQLLTRAGQFDVLSDGQLVAYSGPTQYAVCDTDLTPIVLNPNERWDVRDGDAAIIQGGDAIQVALVLPNDKFQMVKQGQNMFKCDAGFTPKEDRARSIKSGHYEGSAVDPAAEMVELIAASRLIETNVKMIQQQDQMTEGLIGRVLRT